MHEDQSVKPEPLTPEELRLIRLRAERAQAAIISSWGHSPAVKGGNILYAPIQINFVCRSDLAEAEAFSTFAIHARDDVIRLCDALAGVEALIGAEEKDWWEEEAMSIADYSEDDLVWNLVKRIWGRQARVWGLEHDQRHEPYEWLGLIAKYAAEGRYADAAALCISAEIAQRTNERMARERELRKIEPEQATDFDLEVARSHIRGQMSLDDGSDVRRLLDELEQRRKTGLLKLSDLNWFRSLIHFWLMNPPNPEATEDIEEANALYDKLDMILGKRGVNYPTREQIIEAMKPGIMQRPAADA